jgi:hypothetical protein
VLDTFWAGGKDEIPPAERARAADVLAHWRADAHSFVAARLYAGLDAQLGREIATIDKVYREEPEELKDLASHWSITLFQVDEGGSIRHQTEAWKREGLSRALQTGDLALPLSWTAPNGRRYRVQNVSGSSYRVAAAIEEISLRDTLWTLETINRRATEVLAARC